MKRVNFFKNAGIVLCAVSLFFSCKDEDKDKLPVLTTVAVTNIAINDATAGGNITDAGTPAFTERGVCYSTTTEPTKKTFF